MNLPVEWLLQGEPWVVYQTLRCLVGQPENDPQVIVARRAMLASPQIQDLLASLSAWPAPLLSSHKTAGHPLHVLAFLAEIGLQAGDPGVDEIIRRVVKHTSAQGPFQVLLKIPAAYGGSGQDQLGWMLCDAPLLIVSLSQMGLADDPRLQPAVDYLVSLLRQNGWPCAVSPELGKWHGPGRKDDPCPYANLLMLRLLANLADWRDCLEARTGAETLLDLWQRSLESHPYLFYMGNDFRKLKAPLVWYDILHMLDVLSRFPWLGGDARLREMLAIVQAKADEQGRFTPESIWKAWDGWDFGQKKTPSRYLTLLAWRAIRRLAEHPPKYLQEDQILGPSKN